MSELPPSVTARVRVEVEISSGSAWSQDTSMAQITKQAKECLPKLHHALQQIGGRIVGEPKVISILASEKGL